MEGSPMHDPNRQSLSERPLQGAAALFSPAPVTPQGFLPQETSNAYQATTSGAVVTATPPGPQLPVMDNSTEPPNKLALPCPANVVAAPSSSSAGLSSKEASPGGQAARPSSNRSRPAAQQPAEDASTEAPHTPASPCPTSSSARFRSEATKPNKTMPRPSVAAPQRDGDSACADEMMGMPEKRARTLPHSGRAHGQAGGAYCGDCPPWQTPSSPISAQAGGGSMKNSPRNREQLGGTSDSSSFAGQDDTPPWRMSATSEVDGGRSRRSVGTSGDREGISRSESSSSGQAAAPQEKEQVQPCYYAGNHQIYTCEQNGKSWVCFRGRGGPKHRFLCAPCRNDYVPSHADDL